jgi:uncharacterized protein (TIGR03083 family)
MDLSTARAQIAQLDAAFQAELAVLPADTWSQPSDCAGWTIAAAVIHCAQVAELLGDGIRRGRTARAARQQEALSRSPAEILAWYREASTMISQQLDAIPSAPADAKGWHPIGAQPLGWVQDQWLFELALHDWDIRVALDPAAEIRPEVQSAFARTLPARLGRGFNGADDPALAGTYRVEMRCSEPYTVTFQVGGGSVAEVEAASTPDVTIVTDPAAFALVMTNRRSVDRFAPAGRWQTDGDAEKAARFANAFKSY